jgi:glutamate 5-kinase
MSDQLRRKIVSTAKTIVVKVGSRVLTRDDGALDEERISALAEEISVITASGRQLVLVSSGAVAAGMGRLGLSEKPRDLAKLQAVAAIGQARLIEAYDRTFSKHGLQTAQILLTADDFDDRARYLNVRNTLHAIFELGVISVVNENDTVAVDELMVSFGDNDRLASLVTNLLRAPLLIILSDVDGLYDGHPGSDNARLLSTVTQIDQAVMGYANDKGEQVSKGGMASKLNAARSVTAAGENMIIASGCQPSVLTKILAGDPVGTLFPAQGKSISPWKRWIAFSAQPRGRLLLDSGACKAIVDEGRSLLAIGIRGSQGHFQKGDVIALCDEAGSEVARGLTNYPIEQIEQIKGLKSDRIASILGNCPYEEVIHRDTMVVL